MRKLLCAFLALLMLFIAPGCVKKQTAAEPSATPVPTASPTPAPTDEPEATDPIETDEADYYFDFGQDDMIRLNYTVLYPESEMTAAGWTKSENTRVSALLTLQKNGGTIIVLLEEAPECGSLSEFADQTEQLAGYSYEGAEFVRTEAENRIELSAAVPDGRFVRIVMGEQEGLFYTLELCVSGKEAEQEIVLFEEKFAPGVAFAYQQIDTLGSHDEEATNE